MAKTAGVSAPTVHRIGRLSRRSRTARRQALNHSQFVEKVRDIVGVYLNPPEKALVIGVDERAKSRPWIARGRCYVARPAALMFTSRQR
jgi:hypothetical protein